eukprot:TRINITY_DN8090_c0_g1_i2.p2 TRINITY_DN8090_c0_g1~~TRINITY_DN8090_c0_g1_i2.p2  ORF type:complete len:166 (-),score=4.94 TRINITY_DN8090_c0_g1_i2:443-940(-)
MSNYFVNALFHCQISEIPPSFEGIAFRRTIFYFCLPFFYSKGACYLKFTPLYKKAIETFFFIFSEEVTSEFWFIYLRDQEDQQNCLLWFYSAKKFDEPPRTKVRPRLNGLSKYPSYGIGILELSHFKNTGLLSKLNTGYNKNKKNPLASPYEDIFPYGSSSSEKP